MLVTVVTPTGKVSAKSKVQSPQSLVDWRRLKTPNARLETVTFVIGQLSVAPTLNVTLLLPHKPGSAANTRLLGQVIVGGCVSRTVTVKRHRPTLPLASVAELVTVVTPTGNVLPLGGKITRFVTLQLSVALAAYVTLLRLHVPASAANTRLLEHVTTGLSRSTIVMVNVQLLECPLLSVAVLVTIVVPSGKVLPPGGSLTR